MPVLRIVLMRARRRLGIKFQRRIIQLLESDLAGVKAHDREFAHHAEEAAASFLAGTRLAFECKRFEQGSLLFWSEVDETLSGRLLAVSVQPSQASAEAMLCVRDRLRP